MAELLLTTASRERNNSGSTLKATRSNEVDECRPHHPKQKILSFRANLSTHNDTLLKDIVLFGASWLAESGFHDGDLVELQQVVEATAIRDFEAKATQFSENTTSSAKRENITANGTRPTYLCLVNASSNELSIKQQPISDVSIHKSIAAAFGFTSPSQIDVTKVIKEESTSSHVEICFRDAYLSRSDMWRFASQELVGKTVYVGQKLLFLNSLRATVRRIHVAGNHAQVGYFGNTTVPVFRSEAARYVIFIQMSSEMWDFDSEGDGEILFNRVVNGFLPELFKRWSAMDLRHLVSIVMFGRLEYRLSDMAEILSASFANQTFSAESNRPFDHQDFYRVVVTDMASAQWTVILDELKRGFRVFLRDVSLFKKPETGLNARLSEEGNEQPDKITGKLSGALKGNILEAINLAASQFSNDYIDRDLIRTGISTVVITAGSGVFDVDRDLLKLTSETLTNNGIGIDIVCLSRMPLHSVPLFRYRLEGDHDMSSSEDLRVGASPTSSINTTLALASLPDLSASPAFSSRNAGLTYFSRFPSAFPFRLSQKYGYGIPQWIDLSYWSSEMGYENGQCKKKKNLLRRIRNSTWGEPFVPRVRMYELQMMGLMELGMADISIPYLNEGAIGIDTASRTRKNKTNESNYSRSLSRSPELTKKTSALALKFHKDIGPVTADDSSIAKTKRVMNQYDEDVFTMMSSKKEERQHHNTMKSAKRADNVSVVESTTNQFPSLLNFQTTRVSDDSADTRSILSSASKLSRPARAPRNFSYSDRGLVPFKAGTVTASIQMEHIKAQKAVVTPLKESLEEKRPALGSRTGTLSRVSQLTSALTGEDDQSSKPSTVPKSDEGSKPIKISTKSTHTSSPDTRDKMLPSRQRRYQRRGSGGFKMAQHEVSRSSGSDEKRSDFTTEDLPTPSSIPRSRIPFVHNVNASNPLKQRTQAGEFGRWQHLYPHGPRAATVKWRSLCTPASVPLTTDDFPSRQELENDYEVESYTIDMPDTDELYERPYNNIHTLLLEMASLRVAHGYQFVTGTAVSDAVGGSPVDCYEIYKPSTLDKSRPLVVLIMGNAIQKLEVHNALSISVTKYVQKPSKVDSAVIASTRYCPYIRTILSTEYSPRQLTLRGFSEQYPWADADSHLVSQGDAGEHVVERLRYWRARFVLLPVEPPASTRKKHQADEDDEEIHLLGIRALTQLWQKNRYITTDERRVLQKRMGSDRSRDENPLEVKMETLNPSELIATELEKLIQVDDDNQLGPTTLLPEVQKLDNESSMTKIAQAMQSETGIDIKNRRWHLRLHYNCFQGEEFTNWLIQNVKNMNTREDAVEFGNQLMKEGLFEHVNGKHRFKDGHYFYSIKPQYRAPRSDLQKPWFMPGRSSEKSVPATPMAEQPPKELSLTSGRSRSGSNLAHQIGANPPSDNKQNRRKAVSLSRLIRVDVDTRKRSAPSRPEVVNVHYDRFHNPENCYHIELNWLSATCKLVDDAIVSWTNTAEKYGLKLVEVPIAEAIDVPNAEPFRSPYCIKLALDPPKQKPSNFMFNHTFFTATSFGPHSPANASTTARHVYQKAILRRCNFVLDLEAVSEFPEGVDIRCSWGQLEYKHTQYVHRSGVILAQIMDNGDIMLLANRLYNSRLVSTKDAGGRTVDPRRDVGPQTHRPAVPPTSTASMQASGIIGVNLASPSTVFSSPGLRAMPSLGFGPSPAARPSDNTHASAGDIPSNQDKTALADAFSRKPTFAATGLWNTPITPEQIKDDLEAFCQDKARLEVFYKEVNNAPAPGLTIGTGIGNRTASSSSSSLLRPVREVPGTMASDITGIPAFELPEAVTAVRQLRRATVAYDNSGDMFDRSRVSSRNGSIGSGTNGGERERESQDKGGVGGIPPSPLRKGSK
ncbi:vacuolar membrane-associated protein iml1 [Lithohypha guttulata]|nr:vacuolar membrane-associated protein iml1 [Lithohypha guttulata]